MLAKMQRGDLGVNLHQVAWVLLSILSTLQIISRLGPVV